MSSPTRTSPSKGGALPPAADVLATMQAKSPLHLTAKQVISTAKAMAGPAEPGDLAAIRGQAPYSPVSSATGSRAASRTGSRLGTAASGSGRRPGTVSSTLTSATNMSDASRLAMSAGMSLEAMQEAQKHVSLKQFRAREDADKRYSKRFEVLNTFWYEVLRHCTWRKPFLNAVESASAFANVTEDPFDQKSSRITVEELITAFWSAVIVPEHMFIPVKHVDETLKSLFVHFDVGPTGTIDYRELLACINSYTVNLQAPIHKLLRCWYNAYDGDARGGLLIDELRKVMATMCVNDDERKTVNKLLDESMPKLVHKSLKKAKKLKTLADSMQEYADAKRLSKKLGEEYLKKSVPPGEEPPGLPDFKLMWSPFDKDIAKQEREHPHVDGDTLCQWIASDAARDLRNLLHSQRVLRTHDHLRQIYLTEEARKARVEEIFRRDIELSKKADAHRRVVVELRVMLRWYGWYQRNKQIQQLREYFQRKRAVKIWRHWTRVDQQKRGHMMVAIRFARYRFAKRYWERLVHYTTIELARVASGTARADQFFEFGTMTKAFACWCEYTWTKRAYKHWSRRIMKRTLRNWGGYSNAMQAAKAEEGTARAALAASRIDLSEVHKRLEAESEENAATEIAKRHAKEMQRLADESAKAEIQEHWTTSRNAALAKRQARRLRRIQLEEGRHYRRRRHEKEMQAFEDGWADRIAREMAEEKAKQCSYIQRLDAFVELEKEMDRVLNAKVLTDVDQPYSDFKVHVDPTDGCIHFVRQPIEASKYGPAKPAADYNLDSMRRTEGQIVAIDYYGARKAMDLKRRMLEERAAQLDAITRNRAATMWQRAWRSRLLRFRTWREQLRLRLQLKVDPYTGEVYFLDTATGQGFDFPMALLGSRYLLHPLPDWCLRLVPDASNPGGYTYYYQRILPPSTMAIALYYRFYPAHPHLKTYGLNPKDGWCGRKPVAIGKEAFVRAREELTTTEAPFSYVMCNACSIDFAQRQCFGTECHGYNYCDNCFATYHPRDHEEYSKHWDPEVSTSFAVKPGGLIYTEEEDLMEGRKPQKRIKNRGGAGGADADEEKEGDDDETKTKDSDKDKKKKKKKKDDDESSSDEDDDDGDPRKAAIRALRTGTSEESTGGGLKGRLKGLFTNTRGENNTGSGLFGLFGSKKNTDADSRGSSRSSSKRRAGKKKGDDDDDDDDEDEDEDTDDSEDAKKKKKRAASKKSTDSS